MKYYILWISPYIQPVSYYGDIKDAVEYFKKKSLISEHIAHEKDEFIMKNIYQLSQSKNEKIAEMRIWKEKGSNGLKICSEVDIESAAYVLDLDVDEVEELNIGGI